MEQHLFHPNILREYDIRGRYGETLNDADARALGRSFGAIVQRAGGTTVAVGRDGRNSSPSLEAELTAGLVDAGMTVKQIGLGPTPMLYFSVYHLEADAGIMVTGSHNPGTDNGFKMMLGKASFFGPDIQNLGKIAAAGNWIPRPGASSQVDLKQAYVDRLADDYGHDQGLKIAWDCGNGAAGEVLPQLLQKLPGEHSILFGEVDGNFPNHHPDPTVEENLLDLREHVLREGCDLGIGFDGDGDRIGLLDAKGRVIWGDQILALMARDILPGRPDAVIIGDVKASQVLFDEIAAAGGEPVMFRTGHSHIKRRMKELNSPLAGEMSGHIFFADKFYGYDDAIYVAVRFIEMMVRQGQTAAALLDSLPTVVNTPEIRVDCSDERKFQVIEEVKSGLQESDGKLNDIDGVRVLNDMGWWLMRASNTQPALVVRCEAADDAGLQHLKEKVAAILEQQNLPVPAQLLS